MKYNFSLIDLNGPDGNAYALMGYVKEWLKNEGADKDLIKAFVAEATSSDYDNLLETCEKYTDIANDMAYDNGFVDECDCFID